MATGGRPMHPLRKKWAEKNVPQRVLKNLTLLRHLEASGENWAILVKRFSAPRGPRIRYPRSKPRSPVTEKMARLIALRGERLTGDLHFIEQLDNQWIVIREDASGKEFLVL